MGRYLKVVTKGRRRRRRIGKIRRTKMREREAKMEKEKRGRKEKRRRIKKRKPMRRRRNRRRRQMPRRTRGGPWTTAPSEFTRFHEVKQHCRPERRANLEQNNFLQ